MCLEKNSDESIYNILIWMPPFSKMFCCRGFNNKINSLHEQTSRIFGDKSSSFQDLMTKNIFFYQRNIQALPNEMFKIEKIFAPDVKKELFTRKMSLYITFVITIRFRKE